MKTLSKDTKEILTFLTVWACAYTLFICLCALMAQSFNIGVAYVLLFVISGLLAVGILPKE